MMSDFNMAQQPKIETPCPSCGHRTLFIGSGGHLTCSWLKCKEPGVEDAIDALRAQIPAPVAKCLDCGTPYGGGDWRDAKERARRVFVRRVMVLMHHRDLDVTVVVA